MNSAMQHPDMAGDREDDAARQLIPVVRVMRAEGMAFSDQRR
jgi:hypothetical protein